MGKKKSENAYTYLDLYEINWEDSSDKMSRVADKQEVDTMLEHQEIERKEPWRDEYLKCIRQIIRQL